MIWNRIFRKTSAAPSADIAWWQASLAAERTPTLDAIAALRARMASSPDERERQEEMIDGLERLTAISGGDLPILDTQHRVVGTEACHLVAPASLIGLTDEPGKLLITSGRLIHAGATLRTWPWHRIGGVDRTERALEVTILGAPDTVNVLCNTYGDAMAAAHLARRLQR